MAAPTTEVTIDSTGLRFRYLWPGSPTLQEAVHTLRWEQILAVAVYKRDYSDHVVSYLDFYLEDGWYNINDQPWIAGWESVLAELPRYLPLRLPDWRERLSARRTDEKPLLIFLRGTKLPDFLLDECEQCGSIAEFDT